MGDMIDNMIAQGGEAGQYIADHPTQVINLAVQSLPYIFGGGLAAKGAKLTAKGLGLKKVGSALDKGVVAGAVGEGLIVGGQAVTDVIAETDSVGEYSTDRLKAILTMPTTAAISLLGGKVANKAGIRDVDTILGSGGATNILTKTAGKTKSIFGGGLIEGAEELFQGAGEQVGVNYAKSEGWGVDGKNLLEDVGGEAVIPGNIIARQRGTKWHPGDNVGLGKDHTIFSLIEGVVTFGKKKNGKTYISVAPNTIN